MQAATISLNANIQTIKNMIEQKMDFADWKTWIEPLMFEVSGNVLVLGAQNQFSCDYISGVHYALLKSVAAEFGLDVKIVVRSGMAVASIANDNNMQSYAPVA